MTNINKVKDIISSYSQLAKGELTIISEITFAITRTIEFKGQTSQLKDVFQIREDGGVTLCSTADDDPRTTDYDLYEDLEHALSTANGVIPEFYFVWLNGIKPRPQADHPTSVNVHIEND